MKTNDPRFEIVRRCRDGEASAEEFAMLESSLRDDKAFRDAYVRYINIDMALGTALKLVTIPIKDAADFKSRSSAWVSWRPLSAAAAGLLVGMFCTSMVFGFVSQRLAVAKKLPIQIYSPGMEAPETLIDKGLPHGADEWGADAATVVMSESAVQPSEGRYMLRLDPKPRDMNLPSRAYQVVDLRSLPMQGVVGDAELQVTSSFHATNLDFESKYLIRAVALNETPEQALKDFWSKVADEGVVSVAQRFKVMPGDQGWHSFSLKMPLPRGAQTLVLILGAFPPEDESIEPSVHYVDDVQVSVITSPPPSL
jgi:hypothetical protein